MGNQNWKRGLASPTRIEWLVIGVIILVLLALLVPWPHHRETRSESCDICGNCRVIIRDYRWWQLSSETIESTTSFPVAPDREHQWWQYSASYVSWNKKWASSNTARYRNGHRTWDPSP